MAVGATVEVGIAVAVAGKGVGVGTAVAVAVDVGAGTVGTGVGEGDNEEPQATVATSARPAKSPNRRRSGSDIPNSIGRTTAMFIDIHTHIDQYEPAELPGLLARASAASVGCMVSAGTTLESSRKCVEMARANGSVLAGVGVHPQDLHGELAGPDLDGLDELCHDPRVVAVSEIGLDFQPDSPDRELQGRALRAQVQMARRHGLPVIFHMRESIPETLALLRETRAGELGGAAHYFQGSLRDALEVIDLGFMVSLAKPLLRLPELQEVAGRLPLSKIVLETDAYPQYFKSKRERWTEPKDVPLVAARLAEVRGVELEEIAEATTANALTMFGGRSPQVRAALASGEAASGRAPSG